MASVEASMAKGAPGLLTLGRETFSSILETGQISSETSCVPDERPLRVGRKGRVRDAMVEQFRG